MDRHAATSAIPALCLALIMALVGAACGEGTTLEEAELILHKNRIEKLLVVDDDYNLKGLITVKDIQKKKAFPDAAKNEIGQLRVGAAVGIGPKEEKRAEALVAAGCDVLVVDSAHGHSKGVIDTLSKLKNKFPGTDFIAGNVATDQNETKSKFEKFSTDTQRLLSARHLVAMTTRSFGQIYKACKKKKASPKQIFRLIQQHPGGVFPS